MPWNRNSWICCIDTLVKNSSQDALVLLNSGIKHNAPVITSAHRLPRMKMRVKFPPLTGVMIQVGMANAPAIWTVEISPPAAPTDCGVTFGNCEGPDMITVMAMANAIPPKARKIMKNALGAMNQESSRKSAPASPLIIITGLERPRESFNAIGAPRLPSSEPSMMADEATPDWSGVMALSACNPTGSRDE